MNALHYEISLPEIRTLTGSTGDFDGPRPLCRNGSAHARTTRAPIDVTCEPCRQKLRQHLDLFGTDTIIRWAVTHVNKHGMRTLASPAQGRFMNATEAEAREDLANTLANNSAATLEQAYGHPSRGRLEVRAVPCYPGHFDPKNVWFD